MKARLSSLISRANSERCGSRHYPVLSMTMHDGLVLQSDRFKKEIASKNKSQYKVVRRGQLVVGFPIDEGVLATQEVTDRGIVSPAYDIWDIEQSLVLPKYLELSLRSEKAIEYYRAKLKGTTARRRSIRKDDFLSMSINVPGIDQQRFALDRMKAVDGLLSGCRFQLDKLDDLVKSRFIEMFGDCSSYASAALADACIVFSDGDWIESKDQSDEGIRLIQTGNIGNGVYLDKSSRAKFVSLKTFKELRCTEVFPGDILISRLPDPVGRCCIVPDGLGRSITAVDCSIVRLSPDWDPVFFRWFTLTDVYQAQIKGSSVVSVGEIPA